MPFEETSGVLYFLMLFFQVITFCILGNSRKKIMACLRMKFGV